MGGLSQSCLARCSSVLRSRRSSEYIKSTIGKEDFFCLDAAWLNEGSLSGRSPFCQRKLSEESQIHWKSFSAKATILKQTTKKHQPHCSLPESAGAGGCSLFLGRLDQGLVGNAESTHVNRPKGKATLVP